MLNYIKKLSLFLLFSTVAFPSMADWQLNSKNSVVNFTTVKKEHLIENHYFDRVSASISKQGIIDLAIDLTSVNTKIEIRDQRIKEHLFQTALFPKATFSATIDIKVLDGLTIGSSQSMQVSGSIDLHGHKQDVAVKVLVVKMSSDKLLITSQESLVIKAQDFDLVAGINKLKELANLPSISQSVALNFVLDFTLQ